MLVKLTEVFQKKYSSGDSFSLREVFINPDQVCLIRSEPSFRRFLLEGKLPKGVDHRVEFSRIAVSQNNYNSTFVVVGSPEVIESKMRKGKGLIKG